MKARSILTATLNACKSERRLQPEKHPEANGKLTRVAIISGIAALSVLALGGCADLNRKLAHSANVTEVAMSSGGDANTDVWRVEKVSVGSGKISTGRASKDAHGVFVSGYVERLGPGRETGAWSHIDVAVVDSSGRTLHQAAAKFFPSEVPATQRGITGRSRYFVRLPIVPPAGATVRVAFHQSPRAECERQSVL